jgi:hypothetical protein
VVRVTLDIDDKLGVYDEERTPLFIVPLSGIPREALELLVRLKIGNYNTCRIHHFDSSLLVFTIILPRHTAMPAARIITHSHIVKRVNREAKISLELLLVKTLGMFVTEVLEKFHIYTITFSNLAEGFHRLGAFAYLVALAIAEREDYILLIVRPAIIGIGPVVIGVTRVLRKVLPRENVVEISLYLISRVIIILTPIKMSYLRPKWETEQTHIIKLGADFVNADIILNRYRDNELLAKELPQMLTFSFIPETKHIVNICLLGAIVTVYIVFDIVADKFFFFCTQSFNRSHILGSSLFLFFFLSLYYIYIIS